MYMYTHIINYLGDETDRQTHSHDMQTDTKRRHADNRQRDDMQTTDRETTCRQQTEKQHADNRQRDNMQTDFNILQFRFNISSQFSPFDIRADESVIILCPMN